VARLCLHHQPVNSEDDPEFPEGAGSFSERAAPHRRDYRRRAFTVGIGGAIGPEPHPNSIEVSGDAAVR
jgi:hypothetical protein